MARQAAAAAVRTVLPTIPIIVDGGELIPDVVNQQAIPHADESHDAVSAAAVLAKSCCDRVMVKLDAKHPATTLRRIRGRRQDTPPRALSSWGLRPHIADA